MLNCLTFFTALALKTKIEEYVKHMPDLSCIMYTHNLSSITFYSHHQSSVWILQRHKQSCKDLWTEKKTQKSLTFLSFLLHHSIQLHTSTLSSLTHFSRKIELISTNRERKREAKKWWFTSFSCRQSSKSHEIFNFFLSSSSLWWMLSLTCQMRWHSR